jgi:hypothetical protein
MMPRIMRETIVELLEDYETHLQPNRAPACEHVLACVTMHFSRIEPQTQDYMAAFDAYAHGPCSLCVEQSRLRYLGKVSDSSMRFDREVR